MAHLHQMLLEIAFVVRAHRWWMTWNLMLAAVPAVLAAVLFAAPHRRRVGWWIGVAAFVVTLPNAPYVVTDLVHLADSVALASSGRVVVGVVLPLYAAFVVAATWPS